MTDVRHIVCPHCDSVNRIPADRPAAKAKCGQCHQPLFTGRPHVVSGMSFDKQISRNDIPVVVDFWADWCGPCHAMAPVYERVTSEMEPEIRFLKLDTEADPDIANRYRIRGIPTLIVFRNGQVAAQTSGASNAETLRNWLRPFAGQSFARSA